ncbi:LuxR C-terminal-related transcriptional regulator [uncultured Dokdonia sp.]|uniref:helix-turn-helix and ligand-binding sensor domain-containing protein n=1 Tax=uncultured Dokdonia sp. TaxID=575653 RepID=UPI0026016F5A|nr:LuxR C-terminal-related transcriptional regulator [uncultured Dokdonia sp.]
MKTLVTCLLILLNASCLGQIFSPQIDNYGFGDNQNWGVDASSDDLIFLANNKGLVRYNGQQWQLMELPKKTIIRSVLSDVDKIYTGSYEDFGYWEKDLKGTYTYHSLKSLFKNPDGIGSEEFWQILKFKDDILFRSFGGLYIYDGQSISKVDNSQGVSSIVLLGNKVIVATPNNGLLELIDGTLQEFDITKADSFRKIKSLASFNGNLFIFDEDEGGFTFNGLSLIQVPESLNETLKRDVLNKAEFIDDHTLALGTIKNGVILYDLKSKTVSVINKEFGLNNNTVLGLDYHKGNLWVALDNGVSKVNLKSSYRYYFDFSGDLGTVYDVAFFKEKYYLASNTGIYTFYNNELKLIKSSEGHVWNLTIINDQLFCGHNDGTYRISNDKAEVIDLSYGGVYGYTKIPATNESYLQATYSGINVLNFAKEKLIIQKIEGIDFPINSIAFVTNKTIWASHPYKGLFKFELDTEYTQVIAQEDFSNDPDLSQYKTEIFKIGDRIFFYNSNAWFTYSNIGTSNTFIAFKKLKGLKFLGVEDLGTWFLDRQETRSLVLYDNSFNEKLRLTDFELSKHLVANYGKVVLKNDSIRMLNLNDGFATFNINTIQKEQLSTPVIDKVYSTKHRFAIDSSAYFQVSYQDGNYLTFEVYSPNTFQNEMGYVLTGEADQHQAIKNGKFTLQNLDYGNYTLHIFNNYSSENLNNNTTINRSIRFKVMPPWYFSNLAFVLYTLIICSLLYLVYLRNQIKRRKEYILLKRQYTKETQEKIYELEKANLEKQVKDKKKELTNSTASIIKKNEAIILLRNELNRLKDVSPNQYRTKNILASSQKHINSKNDWKQFEDNFKEFNADFFDNLIKAYPKMTSRDLKLCAYIKTGLTSKEIAPLLGISKRGVELQRYRLRKKLDMGSNDNFVNFLDSF